MSVLVAVSVVKLLKITVKLRRYQLVFELPVCEFALTREGQVNCSFLISKATVSDGNTT
jgi:hypothetical protein